MRDPLLVVGGFAGVLVVKALAALFALRLTGLGWKTAAGTALGLSHIGEFAFVLMLLAWKAGAVDDQAYRLVVTLAVGSLILTPFFMRLGLRWIDTAAPDQPAHALSRERSADPEVQQAVVIGIGPIGQSVASRLEIAGRDVCLVDLSPVNLHPFALAGFRTVAGDATDPTVLSSAHVETASIVVICVPDDPRALRLVREIRRRNPRGRILVRCRYQSNDQPLRKAGADHVVSEESQASEALSRLLDEPHLR